MAFCAFKLLRGKWSDTLSEHQRTLKLQIKSTSPSCLETFNYFPTSSRLKVKLLGTDPTKTSAQVSVLISLLACGLPLRFSLFLQSSTPIPDRQKASSFSLPHSVPFPSPHLNFDKALNYHLRYRCFDLFVVSLPHRLSSELRAGSSVVSRCDPGRRWPSLVFCKHFSAGPPHPHPHQAFPKGGHPRTLRAQPQAAVSLRELPEQSIYSPHGSQVLPPQLMVDPEALLEGDPASVRRSGVLP